MAFGKIFRSLRRRSQAVEEGNKRDNSEEQRMADLYPDRDPRQIRQHLEQTMMKEGGKFEIAVYFHFVERYMTPEESKAWIALFKKKRDAKWWDEFQVLWDKFWGPDGAGLKWRFAKNGYDPEQDALPF